MNGSTASAHSPQTWASLSVFAKILATAPRLAGQALGQAQEPAASDDVPSDGGHYSLRPEHRCLKAACLEQTMSQTD
jgi:hypothetical protein